MGKKFEMCKLALYDVMALIAFRSIIIYNNYKFDVN